MFKYLNRVSKNSMSYVFFLFKMQCKQHNLHIFLICIEWSFSVTKFSESVLPSGLGVLGGSVGWRELGVFVGKSCWILCQARSLIISASSFSSMMPLQTEKKKQDKGEVNQYNLLLFDSVNLFLRTIFLEWNQFDIKENVTIRMLLYFVK